MQSDFGLCVQRYDKSSNLSSDNCVGRLPIKWLAIESLKEHEFSLQSDIWSFGMILYEIHSFGEIPFKNVEISQLMEHLEAGNRPEKPEFCSEEMFV
uniref:Protein kinase domain-containing protein n=1 Tax=Panagrolaimus superbus TaxID=310955 RepID=A0A914Y9B3_9BILA